MLCYFPMFGNLDKQIVIQVYQSVVGENDDQGLINIKLNESITKLRRRECFFSLAPGNFNKGKVLDKQIISKVE